MFFFVLIGLAAAFAVMLLFGGMELDRALLFLGYAGERPDLAAAARALTQVGGARFLIPIVGAATLFLLLTRRWIEAALLLFLTAGGGILVELMKVQVARLRPEDHRHLIELEPLVAANANLAFPSAHAANATIVFLGIALLLTASPRPRALAVWAAVWLSLAIGATRVMLGVHWPTDVIAGWTFGLAWTLLVLRLAGRPLGEAPAPPEGTPRPLRHYPPEGERDERPEPVGPGQPWGTAGGRSPPDR